MMRNLELDVFGELMGFVGPRAARCPTLADAQTRATNNIPNPFAPAERAALTDDIARASTSADVIVAYINYAGLKLTRTVFPDM